jgi:type II secretion system protein D
MIERMIRDLDSSSTGSKNIRIFKLTNADALAMSEILTELFKLRQGSNLYVLKPREDQLSVSGSFAPPAGGVSPMPEGAAPAAAGDGLFGGVGGTELTAVPDERQQLSITVDSRTNSLIVSGTPTYLDLVAKVVEELDSLEANEREVYVYQLRNAVAEDVARVVSSFVEQEQQKLVGTLSADQLGSAARLLEREVTIQGDEKSNTVLVSASPRYMERMKEMINSLDVDPPQVLIQVMLAEVTLDTRDDWGVDMEVRAEVDGADISAGYGLASAFVPGLGVPNIAIAASDFDLLIRALKAQGRLQVLSNPSIMAASNAKARIQVGETLRLPTSTSISDGGRTSSTIEKEDVGVILEVTPSINPDGFVRMDIKPEISSLSARTTQISEDFESPVITRRTADTTVTVHDGQTIVLGGLISDRFERRDRMVPLLGELPVIGAMFRSETEETAKTELLIVLTPHVIGSPTEFARVKHITDREIERLSVPEEVKQSIRKNLLDGTGGLYDAQGNRIDVQMDEPARRPEEVEVPE